MHLVVRLPPPVVILVAASILSPCCHLFIPVRPFSSLLKQETYTPDQILSLEPHLLLESSGRRVQDGIPSVMTTHNGLCIKNSYRYYFVLWCSVSASV